MYAKKGGNDKGVRKGLTLKRQKLNDGEDIAVSCEQGDMVEEAINPNVHKSGKTKEGHYLSSRRSSERNSVKSCRDNREKQEEERPSSYYARNVQYSNHHVNHFDRSRTCRGKRDIYRDINLSSDLSDTYKVLLNICLSEIKKKSNNRQYDDLYDVLKKNNSTTDGDKEIQPFLCKDNRKKSPVKKGYPLNSGDVSLDEKLAKGKVSNKTHTRRSSKSAKKNPNGVIPFVSEDGQDSQIYRDSADMIHPPVCSNVLSEDIVLSKGNTDQSSIKTANYNYRNADFGAVTNSTNGEIRDVFRRIPFPSSSSDEEDAVNGIIRRKKFRRNDGGDTYQMVKWWKDSSRKKRIESDLFNIFKNVINMLTCKYPQYNIKDFFFNSQNKLKEEYESNKKKSIQLTSYECNRYNNLYTKVKYNMYYANNDTRKRNGIVNVKYKYDIFSYCMKNIKRNITILSHFLPHKKDHNFITKIKFDRHSENIITSGKDGFIKIYHVVTGNLVTCIRAHSYGITDFDVHKSNKYIISCDEKGIVKFIHLDKYKFKVLLTYRRTFFMKTVKFFYSETKIGTAYYDTINPSFSSHCESTPSGERPYKTYALCSTNSYFFIIVFDDLHNSIYLVNPLMTTPMGRIKFFPYLQFSYSLNYNIAPYIYNNLVMSKSPIKELKNGYLIFINTQNDCVNKICEDNFVHTNYKIRKKKLTFLLLTTKIIYDNEEVNDYNMSITPENVVITNYVNKLEDITNNNQNTDDVIELAYKGEKKKKNLSEEDLSYRKIFQYFEINILQNVKNNVGFAMFKTFEDFNEEILLFTFSNNSANFVTVHTNGSIYFWRLHDYILSCDRKKKKKNEEMKIPICCFYTSLYVEFVMESSALNDNTRAKCAKGTGNSGGRGAGGVFAAAGVPGAGGVFTAAGVPATGGVFTAAGVPATGGVFAAGGSSSSRGNAVGSVGASARNVMNEINREGENNNLFVISSTSCSSYCYSSSEQEDVSMEEIQQRKEKKKKNFKSQLSQQGRRTPLQGGEFAVEPLLGSFYQSGLRGVSRGGNYGNIEKNYYGGGENISGRSDQTQKKSLNCMYNEKASKSKLRAKKLHYKISNVVFNTSDEYIIVADGITNKSNSSKETVNAVTMKTNLSIFHMKTYEEIKCFDLKKCDSYVSFIEPNPFYKDVILFACFRKYIYLLNLKKIKIIKKYSYDSQLKNLTAEWSKNGYTFVVSHNYGYFSIFTINNNLCCKLTLTEQITSSQICYLNETNTNETVDNYDNVNLLPDVFIFDSYSGSGNTNQENYWGRYNAFSSNNNNTLTNGDNGTLNNVNNVVSILRSNAHINDSGNGAAVVGENNGLFQGNIVTRNKNRSARRINRIIEDSSDVSSSANTIYTLYTESNSRHSAREITSKKQKKSPTRESARGNGIPGGNRAGNRAGDRAGDRSSNGGYDANDDVKVIEGGGKQAYERHVINLENIVPSSEEVINVEDVHRECIRKTAGEKKEIINIDSVINEGYGSYSRCKGKRGNLKGKEKSGVGPNANASAHVSVSLIDDNNCIQINDTNATCETSSEKCMLDENNNLVGKGRMTDNERVKKVKEFFFSKANEEKWIRAKREEEQCMSHWESDFDAYSSISFFSDDSDYDNYTDGLSCSSSVSSEESYQTRLAVNRSKWTERSDLPYGKGEKTKRSESRGDAILRPVNVEQRVMHSSGISRKKEKPRREENRLYLSNFSNTNVFVDRKFKIYDQELQPLLPQYSSFNSGNSYLQFLKTHPFDSICIYLNQFDDMKKELKMKDKVNYKELILCDILHRIVRSYRKNASLPFESSYRFISPNSGNGSNQQRGKQQSGPQHSGKDKCSGPIARCDDETKSCSIRDSINRYETPSACDNFVKSEKYNLAKGNLEFSIASKRRADTGVDVGTFVNTNDNGHSYEKTETGRLRRRDWEFSQKINKYVDFFRNKSKRSEKAKRYCANAIRIGKIYDRFVSTTGKNDTISTHISGCASTVFGMHCEEHLGLSVLYRILRKLPCREGEDIDSFIYYNRKHYHDKKIKNMFRMYLSHYETVDENKVEMDFRLFVYSNSNNMIYMNCHVKTLLYMLQEKYMKNLVRENYNLLNCCPLKGRNCIIKNIDHIMTCAYFNPYSVYVRSPIDNYDVVNTRSFNNSFLSSYARYNDFFTMFRNNVYTNNASNSLHYENLGNSARNTEIAVISEDSSVFTSDQSANYFSEEEEDDDDDDDDYDYDNDDYDFDCGNGTSSYNRRHRRNRSRTKRKTYRGRSTARNNRSRRTTARNRKKNERKKKNTDNTTSAANAANTASAANINVRKSDRLRNKEQNSKRDGNGSGSGSGGRYVRNPSNTSRSRYNTRSSNLNRDIF
ncbi:WD repeat-containing protein, putative [Plasmodium ovale wallikeri]|uniref:WD repeat-containing protein, putative n=1 Tax=Plasmodium ovale wallikeri TaxID=864142 RepID=A0A1A8YRK2_PLAOA|nr:WD repeat-containing protein, putative [Plasmodium ovale wallikeri]SBT34717.1 WD repeat-containing protein, putative [Plasmodium ovale wallikeri]